MQIAACLFISSTPLLIKEDIKCGTTCLCFLFIRTVCGTEDLRAPGGGGVLVDPVNSCSVKYYSNLPGIIQYRERLMGMNCRSTVTHSLLTFLLCVDGLQMDRESTMQLLLDLSNVSV